MKAYVRYLPASESYVDFARQLSWWEAPRTPDMRDFKGNRDRRMPLFKLWTSKVQNVNILPVFRAIFDRMRGLSAI